MVFPVPVRWAGPTFWWGSQNGIRPVTVGGRASAAETIAVVVRPCSCRSSRPGVGWP